MLTLLGKNSGPNFNDNDYVSFKKLKLIGYYGDGPFGMVRIVQKIDADVDGNGDSEVETTAEKAIQNGTTMLFEKYSKKDFSEISEFKEFYDTLTMLRHENIIKIFGWTHRNDHYGILFEFMEGDSLHKLIRSKNAKYSFKKALNWNIQSAKAINYLHRRNFVHGQIMPQNMLLDGNFRTLKLSKFEQIHGTTDGILRSSKFGVEVYDAPEVHENREGLSKSSDVYSWALSFWECCTRKYPFDDCETIAEYREKLRDPKYLLEKIPQVPEEVNDVIRKCSSHDPNERFSMGDVVDILEDLYDKLFRQKKKTVVRFASNVESIPAEDESVKADKNGDEEEQILEQDMLDSSEDFNDSQKKLYCFIKKRVFACRNLAENKWKEVYKFPRIPFLCDTNLKGKIYGFSRESRSNYDSFHVFETKDYNLKTLENHQKPRDGITYTGMENDSKNYILLSDAKLEHTLASVELYDCEKNEWKFVKRYDAEITGNLKLLNLNSDVMGICTNFQNQDHSYQVYKPDANEWFPIKSPKNFYHTFSAVNHRKFVCISNGRTFDRYIFENDSWKTHSPPFDQFMLDMALISFNDKLWAIPNKKFCTKKEVFVKMYDDRMDRWLEHPYPPMKSDFGNFIVA